MSTFSIRGDQLIVDPAVGTNSSHGTATVQWGRQLWSKEHRIEITSVNDSGTELTGRSGITGMRVYDSGGKMVAEYTPMNRGQTANIQRDISGLGDGYARINTSVMKPSQGSPWIGPIMITNGEHNFSTLPKTFHVGNGAYDIKPYAATGQAVPCFGPDVIVSVKGRGGVRVADVAPGDRILTEEGFAPVLWVGKRACVCAGAKEWPIEVRGELFSPLHRILWQGRWAKAKHLAEIGEAYARTEVHEIEYIHLLLPTHSVVMTARNRVESLLVTEYSTSLWRDVAQSLQAVVHDAVELRRSEWRRGEMLAYAKKAAA